MKKKITRILSIVLIIASFFVLSSIVFATAAVPYSSYDITRTTRTGTAIIYRCSCTPVDNYLKASCRVQYLDAADGTYKFTSWETGSGSNVPGYSASWTVASANTLIYAEGNTIVSTT